MNHTCNRRPQGIHNESLIPYDAQQVDSGKPGALLDKFDPLHVGSRVLEVALLVGACGVMVDGGSNHTCGDNFEALEQANKAEEVPTVGDVVLHPFANSWLVCNGVLAVRTGRIALRHQPRAMRVGHQRNERIVRSCAADIICHLLDFVKHADCEDAVKDCALYRG